MTVRAKFRVSEVAKTEYGSRVQLRAVTSGSEENKAFFKATPSAELNMSTINEEAAAQFAPGAEFYVDFTPAVTP
jgi:hypothetical protein